MNDDKSLTATVVTTLYQREKLADKIQILIPQNYEELDLNGKRKIENASISLYLLLPEMIDASVIHGQRSNILRLP